MNGFQNERIKGGSMFAPQRILVPTDFSTYSENALKHAMDIAKQNKSGLFSCMSSTTVSRNAPPNTV